MQTRGERNQEQNENGRGSATTSMRPTRPSPRATASTRRGVRTRRATSERMRDIVRSSCRNSDPRPSAIPQVASTRSSSVTASTRSSGPTLSTWAACGTIAAKRAPRIALESSASARTSAKARSARIAWSLRDAAQRRAVLRVDLVELRRERGERRVAELRDEAAREVARDAHLVLLAATDRAVHVRLAVALAREQALRVETDHHRHHGRVREIACAAELLDDVADGGGSALPETRHDRRLEGTEQVTRRRAPYPPERRAHAEVIPPCARVRDAGA